MAPNGVRDRVISEYCRTRLQSRPFTHIVMDMYREVVRSAQYAARKRALQHSMRSLPSVPPPPQQQHHHPLGPNVVPMRQNPPPQQQQQPRHRVKGILFKAQSRNSRSQPNLLSLSGQEERYCGGRTNTDGGSYGYVLDARNLHQRTNSQPDCCMERAGGGTTIPQVRSSGNLAVLAAVASASDARNANKPYYGDPIYAMPVKPFLSTQDVRNTNAVARQFQQKQQQQPEICSAAIGRNYGGNRGPGINGALISRLDNADGLCGPTHAPVKEDLYATSTKNGTGRPIILQRQHSSPQFPTTRCGGTQEQKLWEFANPLPESRNGNMLRAGNSEVRHQQQQQQQQPQQTQQQPQQTQQQQQKKLNPEEKIPYVPRGPPPPKPPRIITSLKKAAAAQAALDAQLRTVNVKTQRKENGKDA
ncbi:hypothetical protein TSAR_016976 [Trichomalopsis sarcophagae]|uniref:Uncharacterized protein n=1 Tax=Trichomalopsis sarcophagae TaxID=543379 RepID=A0A232F759_9HYME|nr:hypothetical protein TSAR_016976 [Trichomalopsis sarcophagae]